ncbi:hypothetical protein [Nocardia sp. NPDC002869]|uniref:hypothetical protein n=1 Tax=Nocardia sp. NPDC002869 TaxID=3161032 RepID=UPI00398C921D
MPPIWRDFPMRGGMDSKGPAAFRELTERLAEDLRRWAARRRQIGHHFAESPLKASVSLQEAGREGEKLLNNVVTKATRPDRVGSNTTGTDPRLAFRRIDRKLLAEYNDLYDLGRAGGSDPSLQPEVVRRNHEFFARHPEAGTPGGVRHQLGHYNALHRIMQTLAGEYGIGVPELRRGMKAELTDLFDGRSVGIRITPESLEDLLRHGRYLPNPERTAGRKRNEDSWFGYPEDLPPDQRPVYGYVMIDGERAAGPPETDMLSNYGRCEIVLNAEVRGRTTACIGDSDYYSSGSWGGGPRTAPSPLTDPEPESFGLVELSDKNTQNEPLRGLDRDYSGESFRQRQFAEAQVHGGVTLADIDHVNLPEPPDHTLREAFDLAGIPWRVVDTRTDGLI